MACKGMRDCVVFTSMRIIAVNVQGITGKKKDFTSLPLAKIQAFSVETASTNAPTPQSARSSQIPGRVLSPYNSDLVPALSSRHPDVLTGRSVQRVRARRIRP